MLNLAGPARSSTEGTHRLHDRLADRWVITQFEFETTNLAGQTTVPPFHECFAVSKSSDPQGAYYTYDFVTPGKNFPDYPHLHGPDGYYMTVNQFLAPTGSFNGVGMYAFDRNKMIVGDPSAGFVYFDENITLHPEGFNATQPSDFDGFQVPAAGTPKHFCLRAFGRIEDPPYNVDALRMFDFHADFVTPANSTFTERADSPLALAPFDPRWVRGDQSGRADIKQPPPASSANNSADPLDNIAYHLMYRLQYRKLGTAENLTEALSLTLVALTRQTQSRITRQRFATSRSSEQLRPATSPYSIRPTFSPDAGNPATGLTGGYRVPRSITKVTWR